MANAKILPQVSCAVLAGGLSKRMGVDKSFLEIEGRPMIEWTIDALRGIGQEIIIVANSPERYAYLGYRVVTDVYPGYGVLGGVYSALYYSAHEHTLMVGCDMPFLNRPLLRYQLLLSRNFDAVVPRVGDYLEPLHAVYSKACMGPAKGVMDAGGYRIFDFYSDITIRYVESWESDLFDPQHYSFINVNTPGDLERVREIAKGWPPRTRSHKGE